MRTIKELYEFTARRGLNGMLHNYRVVIADVMCDENDKPIKKANGENQMETFSEPSTLTEAGSESYPLFDEVLRMALLKIDYLEAQLKPAETTKVASTPWYSKIKNWFKP